MATRTTSTKAKPHRAPLHPGELIADVMDGARLSGRAIAAAIGMSPNGFNKVLTGESPVTPGTALRLGAYFSNGPDFWLDLQRKFDLWHAEKELKPELDKIVPVKVDIPIA